MSTPIPKNQARFVVDELVRVVRGTIVSGGTKPFAIAGIAIDSRAIVQGNAFVAIGGDVHDGHSFIAKANENGATLMLVKRGGVLPPSFDSALDRGTVIEVADTLVALGDLAGSHLARWRCADVNSPARRVVAISGSAGKTTTKELISELLQGVDKTHATPGNLNNRVGVPMVVFGLEAAHRFAVLEMGMSLSGELDAITSIAPPDVSVITNVGMAHAEGVGGLDGVMREKGALYRALDQGGTAIVNADDPRVVRAAQETRAPTIVTFGSSANAGYRLVRREVYDGTNSVVVVATPERELTLRLPLPGEVAAIDLCAALAAQEAASGVRLPTDVLDAQLARVRLTGRATILRLGQDILVLDDTYNANPASMRAALATLADLAGSARRRVAVLGEMRELGPHAETEHVALGDAIAASGVSLAIGCGGLLAKALERAAQLGVTVVSAASAADAAREAKARIGRSDAVLVKGSRGVATEEVVAALTEAWPVAEKPAGTRAV